MGVRLVGGTQVLLGSGGGIQTVASGGGGDPGGGGSGKTLLTSSDFTYLGYYGIDIGGDFCFGQGLAHRYVGGNLRLFMLGYSGGASHKFPLYEFEAPSLNGTKTSYFATWADPWSGKLGSGAGRYIGIWWNPTTNRLWGTGAIDYPSDVGATSPYAMCVSELGDAGSVLSTGGKYGVASSIAARRLYGGFVPIPEWFQTAHGVGPYAVGFGGYTSRMAVGPGSMGPSLFALSDDPSTLADDSVFGSGNYATLADHSSGTSASTDWYTGTSETEPTTFDRGVRGVADDYVNYMNNGLDYQVLGTDPVEGVSPAGDWNEAPDGLGRWLWTDSAFQTGVWIDGDNKHGYVLLPTFCTGRVWYRSSDIQYDGRVPEFQVYDPDTFGEVIAGDRAVWDVKPASTWRPDWASLVPNFTGVTAARGSGGTQNNTAAACSYDAVAKRLYVRWTFATGSWPYVTDRILVFAVAD